MIIYFIKGNIQINKILSSILKLSKENKESECIYYDKKLRRKDYKDTQWIEVENEHFINSLYNDINENISLIIKYINMKIIISFILRFPIFKILF